MATRIQVRYPNIIAY